MSHGINITGRYRAIIISGKPDRYLKDKWRRKLVKEAELERRLYKSMSFNQNLPPAVRALAAHKLSVMSNNTSRVRVKNRDMITGHGRSVYRAFRLSRQSIRRFMLAGKLPYVEQARF